MSSASGSVESSVAADAAEKGAAKRATTVRIETIGGSLFISETYRWLGDLDLQDATRNDSGKFSFVSNGFSLLGQKELNPS